VAKGPRTFVIKMRSKLSSSIASRFACGTALVVPAEFTSAPARPKCRSTSAAADCRAALSCMGRCMGRCPSPGSQRLRPIPAGALADDFDLARLTPEFVDDPYPTYRALQAFAPCKQMANGQYFLTRHVDLSAIYRDVETYSSNKTVEFLPKYGHSPLYEHHTTSMMFNDPPLHSRMRRLISGALTLRAISGMEPTLLHGPGMRARLPQPRLWFRRCGRRSGVPGPACG